MTPRRQKGAAEMKRNRPLVLRRQAGKCARCERLPIDEVHHIVPVKYGGGHNVENLVGLCRGCHLRAHLPQEITRWARQKCVAHHRPLLRKPAWKGHSFGLNDACTDPECHDRAGVPARLRKWATRAFRPSHPNDPGLASPGSRHHARHGPGEQRDRVYP